MKIKRYKKVNRRMNFYINNFGFRQPYQLLVDGTFCLAALKNQINIADNIPKYLQGELKLLTTLCAITEVEKLGPKVSGALTILKNYSLHTCGHGDKPVPAFKCLQSMVGERNENHYIIATQDRELQKNLRAIPGVPLLYLVSKAPVLDQPSQASSEYVKQNAGGGVSAEEKAKIDMMKAQSGIPVETESSIKKWKKKKKGANPLSCLPKKAKTHGGITKSKVVSNKPNRKKVRISQHVRDALYKDVSKLAEQKTSE